MKKELKKRFLADKHLRKFYDDTHDPSILEEGQTESDLVVCFEGNESTNYLFNDGSLVSNQGTYREMSTVFLPNKSLKIDIEEVKSEGDLLEYRFKISDNRKNDDFAEFNRTTLLGLNGGASIYMSDDTKFNDGIHLDSYDTKSLFEEDFGINMEHANQAVQEKNNELKNNKPSLIDFLKDLMGKKNMEPVSNDKPDEEPIKKRKAKRSP